MARDIMIFMGLGLLMIAFLLAGLVSVAIAVDSFFHDISSLWSVMLVSGLGSACMAFRLIIYLLSGYRGK